MSIADMNALPDISSNDSERLQEFVRVTTREVKAVGGASAGTTLEMIGYIRELEHALTNTRAAVTAPRGDRALYSELIHIAAELARGTDFLSTCAEDMNPRLKRADILKTAERQELQLKDWANRVRQVADQLSAAPVAGPRGDVRLILLPQVTKMLAAEAYHYCADCKSHCRQLILTVEALKELNRAYAAATSSPTPAESVDPVAHPFGPCGYRYCDWPDGELRCNEPRSGEASNVAR